MSETLSILKENALKAYIDGNDSEKSLLSNLFGNHHFKSSNILERVTDPRSACEELGLNYDELFIECMDEYEKAEKAIKIVAAALREGKDPKDCFYYPYFYSSGGGFSFLRVLHDIVSTFVGARLRVDTSEKAKHLGQCMLPFYKTYCKGE
jgi:hypothetical protein